jgi:hypothetical protein
VLPDCELYGHGPRETALLAAIVRCQRKDARGLVARCAVLLRLAAQLAPGPDRAIRGATLEPVGDGLRLKLRGDDRLGRWMLGRQAADEAFSATFGRRLLAEDPSA